MTILEFVISSEAVLQIRDILICLSRFNESVDIEATTDHVRGYRQRENRFDGIQLILSALNSSRTSFACFTLERNIFFEEYRLKPPSSERFSFQVLNKAFFSIFKTRNADTKDQDTSIEKCEIVVHEDANRLECRLVAKLTCMHGVKKMFKLTYEPTHSMYPSFNASASQNTWAIGAQALRAYCEHFGTRTEHIDFFHDSGRLLMTIYTEKIARGAEILKQPLQTTIAIDRLDFDKFDVEEHLHVGISVKDFKAIVQHADSSKALITATYSYPQKPMQLTYAEPGIRCAFTLVTMSEYLGNTIKLAPSVPNQEMPPPPTKPIPVSRTADARGPWIANAKDASTSSHASRSFSRDSASHTVGRPSPPPPQASINQESLFLAEEDDADDYRWGQRGYDDDVDAVRWDSGTEIPARASIREQGISRPTTTFENHIAGDGEVPPTQRMSQIHGLFDD